MSDLKLSRVFFEWAETLREIKAMAKRGRIKILFCSNFRVLNLDKVEEVQAINQLGQTQLSSSRTHT